LIGAALTAAACVAYPGFGVERFAVLPGKSRPRQGRYTAFLDVTLALASPCWDWSPARRSGTVFLASTVIVLCAAVIAMRLLYARSPFKHVRA